MTLHRRQRNFTYISYHSVVYLGQSGLNGFNVLLCFVLFSIIIKMLLFKDLSLGVDIEKLK